MRRIDFDPTTLTGSDKQWWETWSQRAQAELKKAMVEGPAHNFKQKIWRDLKDWLLEHVFAGKCAYCEGPIEAGFYGDGEHYRPKGKVTVGGEHVVVDSKPHPGYFWLAYHWKNLIPSCQKCNSGHGKQTQFPVSAAHVGAPLEGRDDPDALDRLERPLLLHPYIDDPEKHLVFGLNGVIGANKGDARGEATINICDLTRRPLRKARRTAQEDAWPRFLVHLSKGKASRFIAKEKAKPYFAAVHGYLKTMLKLRASEILEVPKTTS